MKAMAGRRSAIELAIDEEDLAALRAIARSRTKPASRVERAEVLAYREDPSFFAVGWTMVLHHQTVQRCIERASASGPVAALDDDKLRFPLHRAGRRLDPRRPGRRGDEGRDRTLTTVFGVAVAMDLNTALIALFVLKRMRAAYLGAQTSTPSGELAPGPFR
jgi:hypothetical protein